ncbi:MAG: HlyD family efflux transporter periplasmic adaptor subunit, partial [Planctomycetota bacterium]
NGDGEVDRSEFDVMWEPPDLLVKLDSSSLEDKRMQQQIVCNSSEAAVIQATNNVETARITLKEYLEGIYKQNLLQIGIKISQAVEKHSREKEFYDFSSKLALRGYVSGDQLRADEVRVNQAEDELTLAMKEFEVLEEFSKKKKLLDLEAAIKIAEARLKSEEHSHQLDEEKLEEVDEQIAKCTIRAPQSGQVVYANVSNNRGGQEVIIEEGTTIRERQAIIKLPDPNDMQVKAKINEARVSAVEVGMGVSIELDAFPDMKLAGTVEKVSEYPLPSSWWAGEVKEYETTIKIDNGSFPKDEEHVMRPGMTAKAAIRVEKLDDALMVPVQAVFEHGGKHYCVLREGEALKEREVVIGSTNDKDVVIEEGLTTGEEVVLGAALHRDELDLPEIAPETETGGGEIPGGSPKSREAKPSPGAAKPKEGAGERAPGAAPGAGMPNPAQIFKTMDKNGDGKLEGDEIAGPMKESLSKTDTDGDGAVSRTEFNAAIKQMRGQGAGGGGRPSGQGRPGASGASRGTSQ